MYAVVIVRSAQKELARLPSADYARVLAAIDALAATPRPAGCVKLTGSEFWRIRVGQYRVVYAIKDTELIVTVVKVGNRRDVYR
ncbi:MAG: type II toxin-antitoxin system RelE/ParE family toxin [Chloroflexi bacterium]|nr:type II toxin-antitoxin system RelE/ParE family toxin [Chloroflexota bacterium]